MAGDEQTKIDEEFSQRQMEILGLVAREIIPPSDEYEIPGADDAAILAIIGKKARDHRKRILAGIVALEQFALDDLKTDLTSENVSQVMEQHRKELRSLTGVIMMITAQSYYQDPRVLKSLNLPGRPPFPKGHDVEPGDWTLLDQVKQRGRLYREV